MNNLMEFPCFEVVLADLNSRNMRCFQHSDLKGTIHKRIEKYRDRFIFWFTQSKTLIPFDGELEEVTATR